MTIMTLDCDVKTKECHSCGIPNPIHYNFCGDCGYRFSDFKVTESGVYPEIAVYSGFEFSPAKDFPASDLTRKVLEALSKKGCVYFEFDDGPESYTLTTELDKMDDEHFTVFSEPYARWIVQHDKFKISL